MDLFNFLPQGSEIRAGITDKGCSDGRAVRRLVMGAAHHVSGMAGGIERDGCSTIKYVMESSRNAAPSGLVVDPFAIAIAFQSTEELLAVFQHHNARQ